MPDEITDAPVEAEAPEASPVDPAALAAAQAAPPAEPAPAEVPAAEEEPDPFEDEKVEQFPREYVEKIRREAAEARVKAKEATGVLGNWSDEDRAIVADVWKRANDGDPAAFEDMEKILDFLAEQHKVERKVGTAPAAPAASEEEPEIFTKEKVEELIAKKDEERENAKRLETQTQEIVQKTKDLGYEVGTPSYFSLLHLAEHTTGFDLDKAHELIEAEKEKWIDDYLASKADDALAYPRRARTTGAAAEQVSEVKDFGDARTQLEERLAAMKRGPAA